VVPRAWRRCIAVARTVCGLHSAAAATSDEATEAEERERARCRLRSMTEKMKPAPGPHSPPSVAAWLKVKRSEPKPSTLERSARIPGAPPSDRVPICSDERLTEEPLATVKPKLR